MDDLFKVVGMLVIAGVAIYLGVVVVLPILLFIGGCLLFGVGLAFIVELIKSNSNEIFGNISRYNKTSNYNTNNEFEKESEKNIYKCPYCNKKYVIDEEGFYSCECGKTFRMYNGETYREEETVDAIMESFVELIAYVAKADGVVTKNEIEELRSILRDDFELSTDKIKWCAMIFNESKNYMYDVSIVNKINNLLNKIDDKNKINNLKIIIIECLLQVAFCDNKMSNSQEDIIKDVVRIFKISDYQYESMKGKYYVGNETKSSFETYCNILGVNKDTTINEVKKAYKKLVKEYHPDKYASKNLSEDEVKKMEHRMVEINKAYEEIKKYIAIKESA